MSDAITQLATALDTTERIIAAIRPDQWHNATPCAEWDVHAVASHLVLGHRLFVRALHGEEFAAGSRPSGPPQITEDVRTAYRSSADELLAAFREAGALERLIVVPAGRVPGQAALYLRLVEAVVHGWDLARATGQPIDFPEEPVRTALEFTKKRFAQQPPGPGPFAPPQPVSEGAPAITQLVGLLGRSSADLTT
ncbi:conserved hypothetical protein [Acidothermus cellulolyticus 11B]|uniref:Mycothiol-dependent maleylpyruvate isomerase metal-binding domain-containing protein n=1 Tax=Acidothermus cellulolyticus (strain ATCC 43068 / DSM 8971 / 11B) TaxID=351607 RepID=A0LR64_ACIC1|nr:TIGR03086 family metal-binding protein [Acidothermus cellulolyticus]ABK51924.1 conserved hypothetical protein [Acidothermus cellulolyticus 11B]MCL6549615.1 TIGR03086 family protein [Acidothermus cellulolyticus]